MEKIPSNTFAKLAKWAINKNRDNNVCNASNIQQFAKIVINRITAPSALKVIESTKISCALLAISNTVLAASNQMFAIVVRKAMCLK